MILDAAEQKGTGRWTAQNALELGVPLTGITEAVFARTLSALKDERVHAADVLAGPRRGRAADESLADDLEHALYASKIVSYAQGFAQMAAAADDEGWEIDLGVDGDDLARRLHHPRPLPGPDPRGLRRRARPGQPDARRLLRPGAARTPRIRGGGWSPGRPSSGIPTPAFSSSLAYYDGYRRARGPASLIQGLRDLFGAHTYKRVDREGTFHTMWGEDGREVET